MNPETKKINLSIKEVAPIDPVREEVEEVAEEAVEEVVEEAAEETVAE